MQVARWLEALFRAAVRVDGVPMVDVLQCWLTVSAEPRAARGRNRHVHRRCFALAPAEGVFP